MQRTLIVVMMVVLIPWPAVADDVAGIDLERFLAMFAGEFNNAAQVERDRAALAAGEIVEADVHPWHHHTVRRVAAPALGGIVFFGQITEEGAEGEVVRQRVNVLEPDPESGVVRQRFFGLEGFEAPVTVDEVAAMGPDDLRAYPEGCEVVWRHDGEGFTGTITAGDCRVVSQRSGQTMLIIAELGLTPDGATHMEGGLTEDGRPVFGPPGNTPFKLQRVR
ncbi:MAG TPA: CpcT/CpeT family chromophore lyase [Methylomirabilota bacterium]|nr:CpcT/CpeT family chromophore lyase [Methylomirabilota bacterium]